MPAVEQKHIHRVAERISRTTDTLCFAADDEILLFV